jgi:formylglycine-generating enzyme required for sulfatase activity
VVNLSFEAANAYCHWYSKLTHKDFRLPTELEWEYACRGNAQTRYYWGDNAGNADAYLCDSVNFSDQIARLETKKANDFGLYDMLGSVWEWTSSLYLPYPIETNDGRDELTGSGLRVARGGSFKTHRNQIGCGVRNALDPSQGYIDVGFRIVRFL